MRAFMLPGILLHKLQHRERLPEKTACGGLLVFLICYFNELDVAIGVSIRYEMWKLFFKVRVDDKNILAVRRMLFEVSHQMSDIFGVVPRDRDVKNQSSCHFFQFGPSCLSPFLTLNRDKLNIRFHNASSK